MSIFVSHSNGYYNFLFWTRNTLFDISHCEYYSQMFTHTTKSIESNINLCSTFDKTFSIIMHQTL